MPIDNALTVDANVWIAAADRSDDFFRTSRQFLSSVTHAGIPIFLPEFARIEIACALARRRQDARAGQVLADALLDSPFIVLLPLDTQFISQALLSGTTAFLRGADALYVAAMQYSNARLVSWDAELLTRASAITPGDWLTENP